VGAQKPISDAELLLMTILSENSRRRGAERGPAAEHSGQGDMPPLYQLPNPRALTKSVRASAQVFVDPRSRALLERIELIAPSDANVLITGETGTGKELVARHVHDLSHRRGGPFLAVNCGAFSETLVESELFGHEKGSFTGAFSAKPGWFEAANGGTLFLDEVGDLPMPIQVKLLRVLQEREIVRLGSRQSIPINVRVLAATNVRLQAAVAAGNFREDLFYRLNVVPLAVPTLKERPGDILPLARHFVEEYRARLGYGPVTIHAEAQRKLCEYGWPGNIRELENAIHHGLLVSRGDLLREGDLPLSTIDMRPAPITTSHVSIVSDTTRLEDVLRAIYSAGGEHVLENIEGTVFRVAFDFCHRNQIQTAKLLGISRNVLRARLIRAREISALK